MCLFTCKYSPFVSIQILLIQLLLQHHSAELATPLFKRYEATTTALLWLKFFICLPVRLIQDPRLGVCKAKKTAKNVIL